jgi:alkaline phosphatase
MSSSDRNSLRELIRQRLTRRGLLRASGTGVASVVIVGLGSETAAAAPAAPVQATAQSARLRLADLRTLDPHATTGATLAAPMAQDAELAVKIFPVDPDPAKHPRVETISELLKRTRGLAIGVVTTSEVQDATPAAVFAHTRRRSEYADIMDQALNPAQQPDVLMGGGSASVLPSSVEGCGGRTTVTRSRSSSRRASLGRPVALS